jgi:hypothetical protein
MSLDRNEQQASPDFKDNRKPCASTQVVNPVDPSEYALEVDDEQAPPAQLQQSFSGMAAFGFCFAVLNTWVVLLAGLGAGLSSGGPTARGSHRRSNEVHDPLIRCIHLQLSGGSFMPSCVTWH